MNVVLAKVDAHAATGAMLQQGGRPVERLRSERSTSPRIWT